MKTLVLKDVVTGSYSSIDGCSLYYALKPFFINGDTVMVSMQDFSAMSSSFFNSSFGALIDEFGIDKFRATLKFANLSSSQAKLIKKYFELHLM
ncbi:MAG: STAS-like domain-containing protein [Mangrovibacterium sp.]